MAMVTLASPGNSSLSQTLSFENDNLGDASFSSYLNGAEETFALKLSETSQNLNSLITTPHEHLYLGRKKVEDGEIGVFGAEKYFNGGMAEENPRIANKGTMRYQYEKDEPVVIDPVKPKTQPGTPSAHSESSWNSRSALLLSVQRNPPRAKTNKVRGKSFLASLGCNCACSDKNSIDIDEHVGENNSNRSVSCKVVQGKTITKEPIKTGLDTVDLARINKSRLNPWDNEEMNCKKFDKLGRSNREDCFSFPTLSSKTGNLAVKMQLQEEKEEDDKPRKSLEVFGSPILEKGKKTSSLERRLTMLTWDATPRAEEIEIPASSDGMYDDIGSDASSDLFEIESFTKNSNPFLARQASDGRSSCVTPTTCYAPSEASIEWSVVTASAADFSVMSDSEEIRTAEITTNPNKMALTAKTTPSKGIQKQRPGLLGCKSLKSVRVAGDNAYRTSEKSFPDPRNCHRPDSFTPMTRLQGETKLTGFDSSRNGQHGFVAHTHSRSHTAPNSHLLYIQ